MKNNIQDYISSNGLNAFKKLAYHYSRNFEHSCILDSCQLNTGVYGGKYEFLAAFGAENIYTDFESFSFATADSTNWLFGILGYDLKNKFENLSSENNVIIETPELNFFEPKIILAMDKNDEVFIIKGELTDDFWEENLSTYSRDISPMSSPIDKKTYLRKINEIHELIRAGEVYELNYCVPHSHSYKSFDPIQFHIDLLQKSPVPMAAYLNAEHLHLCGASMERYLLKKGDTLLSQPIKGTIKKGETPQEDSELISQLENSEKDRAENVMIVDLVRNDLNRICESGSVKVNELFGIYSYLQVHQMISTITGQVNDDVQFNDILRATFPMGSMTGAPKIAAMDQIELLEDFKRGWYSGAVGYITPDKNFDFNVVIRSVLCDEQKQLINYNAGGAITIDSESENEWQEIQLKTKAISEVLAN